MTYRSMQDAPENRSIILGLRDGREVMVKWDMRTGEPPMSFWGGDGLKKLWGWCERDSKAPIFPSDIIGWRECDEE
jgi:hypothetical protein